MPRFRHKWLALVAVLVFFWLYHGFQNFEDAQQPSFAAARQKQSPLTGQDKTTTTPDQVSGKSNNEKKAGAEKPLIEVHPHGQDGGKQTTSVDTASKSVPTVSPSQDLNTTRQGTQGLKEPNSGIPLEPTGSKEAQGLPLAPAKVHWTKPRERYPLPKESIITLPTGTPKKMPRIQHHFSAESEAAKQKRLQRQAIVKDEIRRSWAGYSAHAWMHDELLPLSNGSGDAFCGWAATLVDSLDTLWIAGLKDEFDVAAKAAKGIDFTYSDSSSIPVFEVTIRYLGGLLGAYDISGGPSGHYKFLLDKATELAEILMGIFDTPNRMPVMYYRWKPEEASRRHRAEGAGIAELASLSMEFTRLAQLTGQPRYYDAIDRITNGLIAMQKRGTLIPGLFPENLDLSACSATATGQTVESPRLQRRESVVEGQHESGVALAANGLTAEGSRGPSTSNTSASNLSASNTSTSKSKGLPGVNGNDAASDCGPDIIFPARGAQKFHLGGAQDSAYEYFGKEYLLLGGKETKYQKLYEDTVDAANKNLMFRPMIAGDWDIIFPAVVKKDASSGATKDVEYEVSHLTCFVGGMYALGGKLFGREKDLSYAEKLTNGCVWAYQSTGSGLMPDSGNVLPCPTFAQCEFNETLWGQAIDPLHADRDKQVLDWDKSEAERMQTKTDGSEDTHGQLSVKHGEDHSTRAEKPLTHKEFVQKQVENGMPRGFSRIKDERYQLRPEAIESVWYMHRITGDPSWLDKGWAMYEAMMRSVRTPAAAGTVASVLAKDGTRLLDNMQSFWIAETLKYYYLLFSEPNVLSLDEWVLNTEAHPFKLES